MLRTKVSRGEKYLRYCEHRHMFNELLSVGVFTCDNMSLMDRMFPGMSDEEKERAKKFLIIRIIGYAVLIMGFIIMLYLLAGGELR